MEFRNKNPKIYIISGKAKSGKDTVSKMIVDYYKEKKCKKVSYAYYLKEYIKNIFDWDGSEEAKPRDLLQSIGIDLLKNKIDDKFLINRIIEDIEVYSYFYDVIIITDARLIEEVEIPKNKFKTAVAIRVNNCSDNNLTNEQQQHITETDLDNYNGFDYVIENNNDYQDLQDRVNKILEVEDEK